MTSRMAASVDTIVKVEFPWSKQRVHELIGLYEEEEVLWNVKCKDYHNKNQRQAALERLGVKLNVPVNEVNKKLMNLRTYYSKELAKVKKSRLMAGDSREVYQSQWPFFDHMNLFLSAQVVPRKATISELAEENGDAGDDKGSKPYREDSNLGASSVMSSKRKAPNHLSAHKKFREGLLLQEAVQAYKAASLPTTPLPAPRFDDEEDIFGKHVANELRLVSNLRAKQFAKLQIQNILFEAQFGYSEPPHFVSSFESPEGPSDTESAPDLPRKCLLTHKEKNLSRLCRDKDPTD
ncbi:uncharacterized protein LOC117399894 [Acipenser ruthenus]|uniref:uncharacterized protein LOC117399894 n=1 Tax=Acipenser ruthenus TaxID=7906 RepID=UPI00274098F3|nr:uncharacterized protein LOC117399894 [Acipenser ruthenus]